MVGGHGGSEEACNVRLLQDELHAFRSDGNQVIHKAQKVDGIPLHDPQLSLYVLVARFVDDQFQVTEY
ncbi:hypothetical protein D9M72_416820 [compost metagenome]